MNDPRKNPDDRPQTAREVADTVKLGCTGPNQMKSFLRSGMGPCQGRMCGLKVTEVIAAARGTFDTLSLRTENSNAARLYEQMGFRRCGGVADCTHIMELS